MRQRGAHALHLVRRDLLAVAAAADDDAEAAGVRDGALGRGEAERRVVVERVIGFRPVVDGLVAERGQVGLQRLLELVAGVVGTEVDAHGAP